MNLFLFPLLRIYEYAVFYLGWLLFGMLCLVWSLFAAVLHPILPHRIGRTLGRFVIMAVFRVVLAALSLSGRFRFDLSELDALKDEKSLIIAPNHPSLWDVALIVSRLPDAACIMKDEVIRNVFLGAGARLARYIRNDSPWGMITQSLKELERGDKLLLFPEGTRTVRQPINPLKRSIGVIARKAGVPVQTVFIETDSPFLGKEWPLFKMPRLPVTYRVRLGRRFSAPAGCEVFMSEMEQHFVTELSSPAAMVDNTALQHENEPEAASANSLN